ncbi:MAG TPA: hypothetical protein VGB45_16275 [Abditibacterium sp.]|jgi:hypothetical protein
MPRSHLLLVSVVSVSLVSSARADETVLSPESPTREISRREWVEAASSEIGFLASLRQWRETLRGGGSAPRRDFAPLGGSLSLSLGNVAPPLLNSGAGVAARWKALEIGTTDRPEDINDALSKLDEWMTGEKSAVTPKTHMSWLRARALQKQNAELELSMGRAQQNGVGGSQNERVTQFQNVRGRVLLPAKWSLRGEMTRVQAEKDDTTSHLWNLEAAGPLAHPFGTAQARANWREVSANYAGTDGSLSPFAHTSGALEVTQDIALGPLEGKMEIGATQRERDDLETAKIGEETEASSARAKAQLRFSLTPNLSLWSQTALQMEVAEQLGATRVEIGGDTIFSDDVLIFPSEERRFSSQNAADVGAQWKFSRALSLAVSGGASRGSTERESGQIWLKTSTAEEDRRALELRHQGQETDLRVRLSQRMQRGLTANPLFSEAQISQWRIEATRPLLGKARIKTIVDIARDSQKATRAQRYEAQLHLTRAARLDARYREGNLPQGLLSDEWSSAFAAPDSPARQWSARFNAGSTASGGGLGLALEYARSNIANLDSWRVGVQWK